MEMFELISVLLIFVGVLLVIYSTLKWRPDFKKDGDRKSDIDKKLILFIVILTIISVWAILVSNNEKPQEIVEQSELLFVQDVPYPLNMVVVDFKDDVSKEEAGEIMQEFDATLVDSVEIINLHSFIVQSETKEELDDIIREIRLKNDPRIEGVFRNSRPHLD